MHRVILAFMIGIIAVVIVMAAGLSLCIRQLRRSYVSSKSSYIDREAAQYENSLQYLSEQLDVIMSVSFTDWQTYKKGGSMLVLRWKMINTVEAMLKNSSNMDCLFVLGDRFQIKRYGSSVRPTGILAIASWINDLYPEYMSASVRNWRVVTIESQPYLLRTILVGDMRVGVLTDIRHLSDLIKPEFQDEKRSSFCLYDGTEPLYAYYADGFVKAAPGSSRETARAEAQKVNYNRKIGDTDVEIRGHIYISFAEVELKAVLLAFGAAAFVTILFFFVINRVFVSMIYTPARMLLAGNREIMKGNLDAQVDEKLVGGDLQELAVSFNSMVREIKNLRIREYENELNAQKRELRLRNLQLRPHFYLNAMNSVKGLTYQDDPDRTRRFIDALSDYIRYMINIVDEMVTVRQEMAHVENYLKLQNIKAPDSIMCFPEIQENCEDHMIPCFSIYTLVENAVKHGMRADSFLLMRVTAKENPEEEMLEICVENNGAPFADEVLKRFSPEGETRVNTENAHIGLGNLFETLGIVYGRKDLLSLTNPETGGARAVLRIPLKKEDGSVSGQKS